jgi:hypothetical protein
MLEDSASGVELAVNWSEEDSDTTDQHLKPTLDNLCIATESIPSDPALHGHRQRRGAGGEV